MCRYDDDYVWTVEAFHRDPVTDAPIRCEDCGRLVDVGDHVIRMSCESADDDDRPYVHVVMWPGERTYWIPGRPIHAYLDENDFANQPDLDATLEAFSALGFDVDEVPDPRESYPEEPDHYWCEQCQAANRWLVAICDQNTVLVAREDLIEHTHEYGPAQLGPDFMTLATLARQRWRTRDFGHLVPVHVVERLTASAIEQFDPMNEGPITVR